MGRETPTKSDVPWTKAELAKLKQLKGEGWTNTDIAAELGRPVGSVTNKIQREGIRKVWATPKAETQQASRQALKARLKEAEEQLAKTQQLLERERKRKSISFGAPPRKRGGIRRVTFGDTHGCRVDKKAFAAFVHDLPIIQPDHIVCMGDLLDCDGFLSKHPPIGYTSLSEYSYAEDVDAANDMLDAIGKACPGVPMDYVEGNHECLTADHQVLTDRGWWPIAEVTEDTLVASLGDGERVEWHKPTKTHTYETQTTLYAVDSRGISARMTGNHRIAHFAQKKNTGLQYRTAESMWEKQGTKVRVPVSGLNDQEELEGYTDDEIALVAWVLTDGYLSGHCGIAQNKTENHAEIEGILRRCGIGYRKKIRQRKPESICGTAVKTAKRSVEFVFTSDGCRRVCRLFGFEWKHEYRGGKPFPAWLRRLSQRQFGVFYAAVIRGDGSRVATGDKYADCLYGRKDFLENFQSLAVLNGKRCNLASRKRHGKHDYWVLNITDRKWAELAAKDMQPELYSGQVYCLTMPTGNFFTRRNGVVHVTGNSRIYSWCRDQAQGSQRDKEWHERNNLPKYVLSLDKRGVKYHAAKETHGDVNALGAIRLGKIFYLHGMSHAKRAAEVHAQRFASNVVFGHTHRAEEYRTSTEATGVIGAFNPGCLCGRHPMYMHSKPSNWSHGYGLEFIGKDGDFLHINVPIIDGVSLLRPLLLSLGVKI